MSINGSKVKTLLANKINERYELCVLLISSNDVIRFTPFINFEKDLQKMLEKYAKISKKVILIGPANVGDAYLLPALLRIIYRRTAPKYAAILKKISSKFPSVSYINSISPRKELGEYTRKYYGTDMFHPNDDGHEFWFEMIKEKL
jgi:lysophospholipase L1-like esterase